MKQETKNTEYIFKAIMFKLVFWSLGNKVEL